MAAYEAGRAGDQDFRHGERPALVRFEHLGHRAIPEPNEIRARRNESSPNRAMEDGSSIPKPATCHTFRHSLVTHLLESESDHITGGLGDTGAYFMTRGRYPLMVEG